jgi:hypothetical protein
MNVDTWLTLIALGNPVLPALDQVFAEIRRLHPGLSDATEVRTTGLASTCRWGDAFVGLTLVPRPIPASLLDGPVANAWYWPAAAAALGQHSAHLLVNFVDESRDMIDKALRLTALTSAVARASEAVGILWAPAGLVHEPRAFAEQAEQSSRSSLPLYLWIDFRVRQHADGRCEVFTTGLARFGKREIEMSPVAATPQQLLEWSYNLAHYLLDHQAVIKDGDTFGLPDGSQFTAVHATSRIDDESAVLSVSRIEEGHPSGNDVTEEA